MDRKLSEFYSNKIILVTGGTGSIGAEIVAQLLKYDPKTIRILSNSENELWEKKLLFKKDTDKLRFLLGDVRDFERMKRAAQNVDYIFHAAAIKHVPISEYNPMEAIKVNVLGLENVIEAAFISNVKKLVYISTDKAVNPTNVMGATKMLGERICISRDISKGNHKISISSVRFGNVLGSRGSIIPLIKKQIQNGDLITLTDECMRRFFMSISQAANLVLKSMYISKGGEIFVLKMPVIKIRDLLEVLIEEFAPKIGKNSSDISIRVVGCRPGEKIDEHLISHIEFESCYENDEMYIIYPHVDIGHDIQKSNRNRNGLKVQLDENFSYSTENGYALSKEEIRQILYDLKLI